MKIRANGFNSNKGIDEIKEKYDRLFEEYDKTGKLPTLSEFRGESDHSFVDDLAGDTFDLEEESDFDMDSNSMFDDEEEEKPKYRFQQYVHHDDEEEKEKIPYEKPRILNKEEISGLKRLEKPSDPDLLEKLYCNPFEFNPDWIIATPKGNYFTAESSSYSKSMNTVDDDILDDIKGRSNFTMSDIEAQLNHLHELIMLTLTPLCILDTKEMAQLVSMRKVPRNLFIIEYTLKNGDSYEIKYGLFLRDENKFRKNWKMFSDFIMSGNPQTVAAKEVFIYTIMQNVYETFYEFDAPVDMDDYLNDHKLENTKMISLILRESNAEKSKYLVVNTARNLSDFIKNAESENRVYTYESKDVIYANLMSSILGGNFKVATVGETHEEEEEEYEDDSFIYGDNPIIQEPRDKENAPIYDSVNSSDEDVEVKDVDPDTVYHDGDDDAISTAVADAMKKAGYNTDNQANVSSGDSSDDTFIFTPHLRNKLK